MTEQDDSSVADLAEDLVRLIGQLIDEPEEMQVLEQVERSDDRLFEVLVPESDLGKLIGRQGRTARALRAFLDVRGELDGRRYALEIREL